MVHLFLAFIIGFDFTNPDKSFYFLGYSFFQTNGHNKILAGIIINLNQNEVPTAPSSIFDTLKKQNHKENKTPAEK